MTKPVNVAKLIQFSPNTTRIGLSLKLDRPFCIGRLRTPSSNRIESDRDIPGNVIKGVIARTLADQTGTSSDQLSRKLTELLDFDNLIVTHAKPTKIGTTQRPQSIPLNTFDNASGGQLGQGKSLGHGLLKWQNQYVQLIDEADYLAWLQDQKAFPLDQEILPDSYHANPAATSSDWQKLTLKLIPYTPILMNDPFPIKDGEADYRYIKRGAETLIPGSTLKGMFSARSRRILRTLGVTEETVEKLNSQLFGSAEDGIGVFKLFDAVAPIEHDNIHKQTMIAIDRFTGGVKDSALLTVEAIQPDRYEFHFAYKSQLQAWQEALKVFLLRDAIESDFAAGWGKSRGFGAFHVKLKSGDTWLDWQAYLNNLLVNPGFSQTTLAGPVF